MSVIKVDADLFLDDFEAEARAHIEKIEASFLDVGSLASDPALMNGVFRTAHSLKGTAGFFSLEKIVAVAHELESVFSQIKDGKLEINDEIADIVLQSVDCLRDLVDNVRADDTVDAKTVIDTLKRYSSIDNPDTGALEYDDEVCTSFDFGNPDTESMLKKAMRHGHKAYYVNINFNRGLGKYFRHPEGLFDSILSIGAIVEAIVNGKTDEIIRDHDSAVLAEKIISALSERDTSTLELLITSVLEFELFAVAIEISKKHIYQLSRESIFSTDSDTRDESLQPVQEAVAKLTAEPVPEAAAKPTAEPVPGAAVKLTAEPVQEAAAKPTAELSMSAAKPTAEPVPEAAAKPVAELSPPAEELDTPAAPRQIASVDGGSNDLPKAETEPERKQTATQGSNFLIHLDISIINSLLDLANEMVLARNQLLSVTSEYKKSITGLTPILQDMNRLTSEIQEKVMLTRMQPINVIFSKFPRIIRDTAKALKKDIEVEIHGSDVTLDKYLLDALTDPITQLVKNAAGHGVEPAERRISLDKPQKGKITLNAYMRDGSAVIEVMDDGAGINVESVKQTAIERGIVTEETLSAMACSEILELILEPGFSTSAQVTNLSGRGVGMDIVKTNIEKLGGSIEIESEADIGTTIRLRMPLTLSVVRALIVVIDSIQYAVPEINVERIVRIGRSMASRRLERVNDSLVLILGERIIPVVTMEDITAKAKGLEPPLSAAMLESCMKRDVNKCIVLKAGDRNFALLIDDAYDTEQTLVKPLPVFFKNCLCYSSVTVLGNGNAITILDAEGILRLLAIKGASYESPHAEYKENERKVEKQYIIFKGSGSECFALETSEISRIENIDARKIQEIGKGRFISIAGDSIRVVKPESFAPVKNRQYTGDKLYLITLKNCISPIGLLAGKVLDKVEAAFNYDNDRLYSDFIHGTSTYNEKIIIFLNPSAIAEEIENDKRKSKNVKKAGGAV